MRIASLFAFLILAASFLHGGVKVVWPTESQAFDQRKPYEDFIQGTLGKPPSSGLFGDVRNNGYRFHEGIDIKPVRRSKNGEALDEVRAAMAGKVVCVNLVSGNSGYGRYVVLEHPECDVSVYTLYAHLASVNDEIRTGVAVSAGDALGRMGRSSGTYGIGKAESHLHFEIGLRLSDNFEKWYGKQKYKEKNRFGNFNGMNLNGMDPLAFLADVRDGKWDGSFASYIAKLRTAFVVRFYTLKTPDFVKRYPKLANDKGLKCGWDIHFTWYGIPQKFERITNPRIGAKEGEYEIISYDPDEIKRKCRKFVSEDKAGNLKATRILEETLEKIF